MDKRLVVTSAIWVILCSYVQTDTRVSYDMHQVSRLLPLTGGHLEGLQLLEHNAAKFQVDFWRYPGGIGHEVIIRIPPWSHQEVSGIFRHYNITWTVAIDNAEMAIQKQIKDNEARKRKRRSNRFHYGIYHSLDEIQDWMLNLSRRYKDLVSLFNVTKSYEGRSMMGLKIGTGSGATSDVKTRPIFWFHGGIHAREWISPATVIYMAQQLLEQYGSNPDVTDVMDYFDWYIIPVVNVDGYEYSWKHDRLWRKTRSPQGTCFGVDPNRNFDYKWGFDGTVSYPCDSSYRGPTPFSEQEVKGLADFIKSRAQNILVYIDFHSFSQLWLSPFAYTRDYPDDFKQQDTGSALAVKALESGYGTHFEHGSAANVKYHVSGVSSDWAYSVAGIKYSYAVELRDTGQYGFLLPPDQIIPSGRETFKAIMALAKYTKNDAIASVTRTSPGKSRGSQRASPTILNSIIRLWLTGTLLYLYQFSSFSDL